MCALPRRRRMNLLKETNDLKRSHMKRIHTGERGSHVYVINVGRQLVMQTNRLTRHTYIHTVRSPIEACDQCGKVFVLAYSLSRTDPFK